MLRGGFEPCRLFEIDLLLVANRGTCILLYILLIFIALNLLLRIDEYIVQKTARYLFVYLGGSTIKTRMDEETRAANRASGTSDSGRGMRFVLGPDAALKK